MHILHFPQWAEVLALDQLPSRAKHSFEITIRWYLSFCRRARVEVTVQSARDFVAWASQEKHPQPTELNRAIWFGLSGLPGTKERTTCEPKAVQRFRSSWTAWLSMNG